MRAPKSRTNQRNRRVSAWLAPYQDEFLRDRAAKAFPVVGGIGRVVNGPVSRYLRELVDQQMEREAVVSQQEIAGATDTRARSPEQRVGAPTLEIEAAYRRGVQAGMARLLAGEGCESLRGIDLRDLEFDLTGRDLDGCDFTGALLAGVSFTESSLEGACFDEADLAGARFRRVAAQGARFARATAPDADFDAAELEGADFTGAYLVGAEFVNANLCGADFTGADLIRANFTGADLRGAKFARARVKHALLERAKGAGLKGSRDDGEE